MKKITLFIISFLFYNLCFSQITPTLGVGLESLTMNKGTIDVKVLTEIIMAKQKELKQEALRRFMYKLFPETNYTTKFYVQNCLNTLLNEKNPQVIEKEILELTTNYALALGVTYALIKSNDPMIISSNKSYLKYKNFSSYYQEAVLKEKEIYFFEENKTKSLNSTIRKLEDAIAYSLKTPNSSKIFFDHLKCKQKELDKNKKKLARLKIRNNIKDNQNDLNLEKKKESLSDIENLLKNQQIDSNIADYLKEIKQYLENIDSNRINSNKNITILNDNIKAIGSKTKEIENAKRNNAETTELNSLKEGLDKLIKKPIDIPFGIILDVVSHALSQIEDLQKLGFFKHRIDYRDGSFYTGLNFGQAKDFRNSLDSLKVNVCKKINPYIQNYDAIKEFIEKNKNKKVEDIVRDLRNDSFDDIKLILKDEKWEDKYPYISKALKETDNNKQLLSSLTEIKNKYTFPQIPYEVRNTDTDKKIIATYKSALVIRNKLYALEKSLIDKELKNDNELKKKFDEAIKSIPLDAFKFKNKEQIKSILPDSTLVKNESINNLIIQINSKIDDFNSNPSKKVADFASIFETAERINDLIENNLTIENKDRLKDNIDLAAFYSSPFLGLPDDFGTGVKKANKHIKELSMLINAKIEELEKSQSNLEETTYKNYVLISKSDDFYNQYLTSILNEITYEKDFKTDFENKSAILKASTMLPEIYTKIKFLINNHNIRLEDIAYIENHMINEMIELKIRDPKNDDIYNSIIKHTEIIIPLLKIRALQNISGIGSYDKELLNLFEFISNLNKLDKAETYQSIVNMLRDGSKKVEDNLPEGEFKESYTVFINAMKKYTLINPNAEKQYVEVDVVSFLNDLQQYYGRNDKSHFGLYLTLGLNQNFFFNPFKFPDSEESTNNISFASEKIGVKYRIHNFKKLRGYENVIKNDAYLNKKSPFVNEVYSIVYGSGLLYSLANTASNQNFDFAHVGIGSGIRFYNALDINAVIGFPFVKNSNFGQNAFWGIGLDIPLGEYLEKMSAKN